MPMHTSLISARQIYEGTSQIQRLIISREIFSKGHGGLAP